MSYYDEDRPPRRARSTRDRRPREYTEEETYVGRGGLDPRDSRQLVRRRDDSSSSIEEIARDFAPGEGGGYVRRKTTVREGVRPSRKARSVGRYDDSFYDDSRRSDTYASSKRSSRRYDDRSSRRSRRYDDYSDYSSPSRSPPRRRDSMAEKALAALGLGGAATALAKSRSQSHSRVSTRSRSRRGRDYSESRSRSRGRGTDTQQKIAQAVKAALAAGAAEAVRARKEPGGWSGEKGKRILTAAIGAAGVDGLISGDGEKHGKRHIVESALAGLATNRLVNGPRSRSRSVAARGRSRSQSRSRGGIKDLAAGGILAAAGKKIYDQVRSRSRGRARSPSVSSYSSYDSRSPPRRREKKRSQSISDMARKGMAALGIGETADKGSRRKSRRDSYSSDEYDARDGRSARDVGQPRSMVASSEVPRNGQYENGNYEVGAHHLGDPETDSDSDLGSSTDEEKQHKKVRGKQLLTAGLASVATIHAAHQVYKSMEARDERHEALKSGEISKEEARKEKTKARLQDAASVGIAALGIKGALTEWKEVKEQRKEAHEEKERLERHRRKRAARRAKMLQAQQEGTMIGPYDPRTGARFADSAPNLVGGNAYSQPNPYNPYIPPQYVTGPVYHDGNPYAAGSYTPSPTTSQTSPSHQHH